MTSLNKLKIATIAAVLIIPIILWQSFLLFPTSMGELTYLVFLFPFAMNWANVFSDDITFFLLGLALLQFPVYALIIAFAKSRKMLITMLTSILAIHILAVFIAYGFS